MNRDDTIAVERYKSHIDGARASLSEDALAHMKDDFLVDANFTSHLPIVVINTNGNEIERNTTWDSNLGYAVPIPGIDPYAMGTLSVYDQNTGKNSIKDTESFISNMMIRRRGNSSMYYEKGQYRIYLRTESGKDNEVSVMGMGVADEWIISGPMIDKSQMRNYLAYTLASEIMPYTPDVRFCEVLFWNGEAYRYEGIYLMTECIQVDPGFVDIAIDNKYDATTSYLLRRDRFDPDGAILDTWATQEQLSYGYLEVRYPKKKALTESLKAFICDEISLIERILYSEDPAVFLQYQNYIDVDSFVDYYLLNEYLTNYDAGYHSTYMYNEVGKKLKMGPVWDYDGTLDNYSQEELQAHLVGFQSSPWFDRLTTSKDFAERLESRYMSLRKNVFSDDHVMGIIDETAAYLGPAIERDWVRWGHIHRGEVERYAFVDTFEEDTGMPVNRTITTHEDELLKMKYVLSVHGNALAENLNNLVAREDLVSMRDNVPMSAIMTVIFIMMFFSIVMISKRR